MDAQTLDLSHGSNEKREWENEDVLCLIGSKEMDPWFEHKNVGRLITRAVSALTLNPVYRQQTVQDRIRLQMQWPNPTLAAECESINQFLPAEYEINTAFYKRLSGNTLRKDDQLLIRKLVDKLILVALPENYGL